MAQLYSEGDWFGVRFFTARTGSRAAHIHCDDHFKWRQSDSCADRNLLDRCLRRLAHVDETAQNYTVTFTATTGSSKQTIHFMLTVNEDTRTIMSRARNVRRRNCLW
jgi:hypothetical protein